MEYSEFETLLCASAQRNALPPLTAEQIERFYHFIELLMRENQVMNLTAIRNIPDAIDKHLVDSLLASSYIPQNAYVLDLGCGPGFPSIPLAITRPDLQLVALDSTAKKVAFVEKAAKTVGLKNLSAISGRAEDRALFEKLGSFDVVVSRAVARLNVLAELSLPHLKKGGFLLALKGAKALEELEEAKRGISVLGGETGDLIERQLALASGENEARAFIQIQKLRATPAQYPRAYATILKKPL